MGIRFIDPLKDLGHLLLTVEKPARYTGGEYGRLCDPALVREKTALKTLIAFPDLYEIGMSNQALRILYNRLNGMEGVACDRAFAPAPDFEELLRREGLPLYGLDTGLSLKDADLLMFTLGYELGIGGAFSMLDVSGIPLRAEERGEDDPLTIMGGPCVSNPLPYSAYIDAFWIGEAEAGFFELAAELAEIKKAGGKRRDLRERLVSHPSVWTKGKGSAVRAVDGSFSRGKGGAAVFPVPSMKTVHQHGSVEIMRGCPNGCRFCHAGYWYRPMRQKSASLVEKEAGAFIKLGGYREISLSSLSSGDYRNLDGLIDRLNEKYSNQRVSFQLPSLRVSTFSLNLLDKISEVRKSGLTFAVETPADFWQMAINKEVSGEDVVSILREARRRGWRGAKFYFMLGLPLEKGGPRQSEGEAPPRELRSEEEEIAAFVERAARQTGMHFSINVGTFVPKPHTPFQWAPQMGMEEAKRKLDFLRDRLKPQGHKVGVQDPMISTIEGLASRGGEEAGAIFEEAYRSGCRLDSWTEYLKRDVWLALLEKHKELAADVLSGADSARPPPWSFIKSGIGGGYFSRELEKSRAGEMTSPCTENCANPCGACTNSARIVRNIIQDEPDSCETARETGAAHENPHEGVQNFIHGVPDSRPGDRFAEPEPLSAAAEKPRKPDPDTQRILFSFSKQGSAVFQAHLGLLEIFSMAFIRAGIPVLYSQGFNPLPRLDIASPLSLGIAAKGEIAALDTEGYCEAERFKRALNACLPEGLAVEEAMNVRIPSGAKKRSVTSLLWGFVYSGGDGLPATVKAAEEKAFRLSIAGAGTAGEARPAGDSGRVDVYGLERLSVLAKPLNGAAGDAARADETSAGERGVSYFDLYREIYGSN